MYNTAGKLNQERRRKKKFQKQPSCYSNVFGQLQQRFLKKERVLQQNRCHSMRTPRSAGYWMKMQTASAAAIEKRQSRPNGGGTLPAASGWDGLWPILRSRDSLPDNRYTSPMVCRDFSSAKLHAQQPIFSHLGTHTQCHRNLQQHITTFNSIL